MESKRLALYVLAALAATTVYYVLVTSTELSAVALLSVVVVIGIVIPQVYLYLRQKANEPDR